MKYQGIQDLFSESAERYGEETAMEGEGRRITYGELERRSNQVGERLRREGVGRGVVVGLMGEEAIEVVVGMLGILKAGGVYVALDGRFPEKRLGVMVEEVKPEWYVVERRMAEKLERVVGGKSRERQI